MSVEPGPVTSPPRSFRRILSDGQAVSMNGAGQELQRAMCKLESEIREGLAHGFFELSLSCEVIKGGKRRLTIKAGKSYQFVIPEEELKAE